MRSMTEDSVFVYDRTWDGLLTAVFDAFYRHQFPVAIIGEKDTPPLFAVVHRMKKKPEECFGHCKGNSRRRHWLV